MPDFTHRTLDPELMDTEACGVDEFRACLVGLERVNRLTLAYRPTLHWLDRLVASRIPSAPLHIADIGGGYGDVLRRIAVWAKRRGIAVTMTSVDLNPWARMAGEAATPAACGIRWVTSDLFAWRPEQPVDVVLSSLFTHHLTDPQVVRFMRWMEETARQGWFINDLHRHPLPYHVFRTWSRLARWHRFVQHDGPVSIARAFVANDWRQFIAEAGLDSRAVEISEWVPFRLCVGRIK